MSIGGAIVARMNLTGRAALMRGRREIDDSRAEGGKYWPRRSYEINARAGCPFLHLAATVSCAHSANDVGISSARCDDYCRGALLACVWRMRHQCMYNWPGKWLQMRHRGRSCPSMPFAGAGSYCMSMLALSTSCCGTLACMSTHVDWPSRK